VYTTPENLLEFKNPPGNPGIFLEFVWSCKFLCKMSMIELLVSSHDKTGYWIAYLRNWSLFLSLPQAPSCTYHVFVLYLGKLVDSGHCIAGQSTANMSWIFIEMPPGISWKFVQLNL